MIYWNFTLSVLILANENMQIDVLVNNDTSGRGVFRYLNNEFDVTN